MSYQFSHPDVSHALYLALQYEPFYQEMERNASDNPVECQLAMHKYFDYSMLEAQKHGKLYIPAGTNFGASVWCKPLDNALANQIQIEKKDFLRQNLGETCLKKYAGMVEFMAEKTYNLIPKDSWYLSIVGLSPQFQNQGLGGKLIRPILEQIDELSLPSYLETFTPRNISFYSRLGYRNIASFIEPITNSEYWIMLREPEEVSATSQRKVSYI